MAKKAATFKLSENRRRRRRPTQRSARVSVIQDDQERGPFFVRGTQAGSKEEYWVSLALAKIEEQTGWGWDYQVPVYGGRQTAGGNVVDFLVYTPGRWTILEPMGRYWHTGIHEDRSQMENVARRKKWNLIAWFTDETPTRDAVLALLRNKLNVV